MAKETVGARVSSRVEPSRLRFAADYDGNLTGRTITVAAHLAYVVGKRNLADIVPSGARASVDGPRVTQTVAADPDTLPPEADYDINATQQSKRASGRSVNINPMLAKIGATLQAATADPPIEFRIAAGGAPDTIQTTRHPVAVG